MPDRTTYEIVIRGRASARLLRPLLDDFRFDNRADDLTRLVGPVTDAAHLCGLVAHLASVHLDVISIAPLAAAADAPSPPTDQQPRSTTP